MPKAKFGSTVATQRQVIDHLITLGEAVSKPWRRDDDPTGARVPGTASVHADSTISANIKGIGPKWEQVLWDNGVRTVGELAFMTDDQQESVKAEPGFWDARLTDWILQAQVALRENPHEDYRQMVADNQGRYMDRNGEVKYIAPKSDGKAHPESARLLDAPAGPATSLRDAVQGIIEAGDLKPNERMLLPTIDDDHLSALRRAQETLEGGHPLDTAALAELDETLDDAWEPRPSGRTRSGFDPSGSARNQSQYGRVDVQPKAAATYFDQAPTSTTIYGEVFLKDPNYSTAADARRAAPGARIAGAPQQTVTEHDPLATADEDDEDTQLMRPGSSSPASEGGGETSTEGEANGAATEEESAAETEELPEAEEAASEEEA